MVRAGSNPSGASPFWSELKDETTSGANAGYS